MDRFRAAMDTRKLNRNLIVRCLFVICLSLGLICHVAWGQVGAAALSGVVQDTTGAVISGATVTLQNDASGILRTSHSNGSGFFTFEAVPSGDYTLTIGQKGFSQLVRKAIHLNPGDDLSLADLRLEVGAATQTVEVSTELAGLPLDSGQLSATISSKDLDQLSTVGRDATELQRILPGFAIRNLGPQNSAPDFSQVQVGRADALCLQWRAGCGHHSQAGWREPDRRGQLRRESAEHQRFVRQRSAGADLQLRRRPIERAGGDFGRYQVGNQQLIMVRFTHLRALISSTPTTGWRSTTTLRGRTTASSIPAAQSAARFRISRN